MTDHTEDPAAREPRATPPSRSADAAAIRWAETHPEDEIAPQPPAAPPAIGDSVPGRHSASAEAASLRWRERQSDDD